MPIRWVYCSITLLPGRSSLRWGIRTAPNLETFCHSFCRFYLLFFDFFFQSLNLFCQKRSHLLMILLGNLFSFLRNFHCLWELIKKLQFHRTIKIGNNHGIAFLCILICIKYIHGLQYWRKGFIMLPQLRECCTSVDVSSCKIMLFGSQLHLLLNFGCHL